MTKCPSGHFVGFWAPNSLGFGHLWITSYNPSLLTEQNWIKYIQWAQMQNQTNVPQANWATGWCILPGKFDRKILNECWYIGVVSEPTMHSTGPVKYVQGWSTSNSSPHLSTKPEESWDSHQTSSNQGWDSLRSWNLQDFWQSLLGSYRILQASPGPKYPK